MALSFADYLAEVRPAVNDRIETLVECHLQEPDLLPLLLKGKRLRGGLLLAVGETVAPGARECLLDLAAAIELAHSASLILDDMLDDDTTRRGVPSVHVQRGHKTAMLETIGVLSLPYTLAAAYGAEYVQELAAVQRSMVSGVLSEIVKAPDLPATQVYHLVIGRKTGRLFGLAAQWGYRGVFQQDVGGSDRRWHRYGLHVGKAMQIADDIADLKVIAEGKKGGFGSELLLLRCVNVERLVKEFFGDLKKGELHLSKLRDLYSEQGLESSLAHVLDVELQKCDTALSAATRCSSHTVATEVLRSAPREIADMMLAGN